MHAFVWRRRTRPRLANDEIFRLDETADTTNHYVNDAEKEKKHRKIKISVVETPHRPGKGIKRLLEKIDLDAWRRPSPLQFCSLPKMWRKSFTLSNDISQCTNIASYHHHHRRPSPLSTYFCVAKTSMRISSEDNRFFGENILKLASSRKLRCEILSIPMDVHTHTLDSQFAPVDFGEKFERPSDAMRTSRSIKLHIYLHH